MFSKIKFDIKNIYSFCIILAVLFMAFIYLKVPLFSDEADVITGAWLVTKGYVVYKDFFCHHMPLPYYVMSVPLFIYKNAAVECVRGFYYLLLFLYFVFINSYTKNGLKNIWLLIYVLILFLSFNLFKGYWILADTFFALGALTIFISVLNKPKCDFSLKEMAAVSCSIFVCITSTLISVYPVMFFGLYYIVMRFLTLKKLNLQDLKFLSIIAFPFVVWGLYMLFTGTFDDFWQNGFLFNTMYYSKFTGNDTPLTLIVKHFKKLPAFFELNYTLIFQCGFLFYLIKLFQKKEYNLIVFSFLFVYLINMRMEQDFHCTAYYYVLIYIFVIMAKQFAQCCQKTYLKHLFILSVIIFPCIFFFNSFCLTHPNLLWKLKLIKHPVLFASVLQKRYIKPVDKTEYCFSERDKIWAAPLNPIIYFNLRREPANKNIFYLPWQAAVPGENERVIADLENGKVKVIFADLESSVWGFKFKDYAKPVYDYIKQNYDKAPEYGSNVYIRKKV